ncbi:MAG TPA: hypothetical protein VMS79_02930 [Methanomassiliicoccales archaeon]|nr:hypothetical protein [Methanomassiliicoccales archaeon]
MLATTHLLAVLLIIIVLNLDRYEALTVLTFGVFIDLDHLLAYPQYVSQAGWQNALNPDAAMTSGVAWKSIVHDPEFAMIVGPLSAGFRYALPFLVWGLHLTMDWVQIDYLGVASPIEMGLALGLLVAIAGLEYQKFRAVHPETEGLRSYIGWEKNRIVYVVRSGTRTVADILRPILPARVEA